MFDHRAELVGETLVIAGGLTASQQQQPQPRVHSGHITDVALLNTRTLAWSYLDLYDARGRATHLRLHGFSMCQDPTSEPGILLIFGGRETVDAKRAALEVASAPSSPSSSPQSIRKKKSSPPTTT